MRAVILDLDDTLYPQERFHRSGLAAVARHVETQCGIPADRAFTTMLKASIADGGAEFQVLCDSFGLSPTIVPELIKVFRTHRPELWVAHDALDMLRQLRAEGWRLAILTNGLPHVQAAKVRALGLHGHVDHVVYAAEYAEGGKPHKAPFDEAVRRVGVPAHLCVMVGDHPECDVRGGREAGLRTIRVRRQEYGEISCGADVAVERLADVPAAANALVGNARAHAA